MSKYLLILVFLSSLKCLHGQMKHPLKLKSVATMEGNVFPKRVDIATGEDAIFQLLTLPEAHTDCVLTSLRTDQIINIKPNGPTGRFQYWNPVSSNTGCGVRIKSITMKEKGKWKLEAHNAGNKTSQSFIYINVLEREVESPTIYLRESAPAKFNISTSADYCEIRKLSYVNADAMYDKCEVILDNVVRSLAGMWTVQTGIKGQVKEVRLNPRIIIAKEELVVGINYTDSKINLYCNLQNTRFTTFRYCRFIRGDNKVALHLLEGMSDGKYSYYGNGLYHGDCGLTIETPDQSDLTVWKCHIGYTINATTNNTIGTRDSVIYLPRDRSARYLVNFGEVDDVIPLELGGSGYPITISCQTTYRLKYCYLRHPNGTTYSSDIKFDQTVIKTVGDLDAGECGMTILASNMTDTGTWSCHMAKYGELGMDEVKKVNIRIGYTPLVAVNNYVHATEHQKLTLKCVVTIPTKALAYCRFMLPDGTGFNLNEDITENNAINNMYWYDGKGLAEGDCQVTIKSVEIKHFGRWTCSAKLLDSDKIELRDDINVGQGNFVHTFTTTEIIGIVIGGVLILVLVGTGIGICIRRRKRQSSADMDNRSVRNEGSVSVSRGRRAEEVEPASLNERSGIFALSSNTRSSYTIGRNFSDDNIEMDLYTVPSRSDEQSVQVTSS